MTRAEVIIENLKTLTEQYEQAKSDGELDEIEWWTNEFGADLTDDIDCHVVFQGEPPCLCEERGLNMFSKDHEEKMKADAACSECKAIYLMGEYV